MKVKAPSENTHTKNSMQQGTGLQRVEAIEGQT